MKNLIVTAFLANAIAVYDNWSPSLEGLLIYRLLEENSLLSPNPTEKQVTEVESFLKTYLPIKEALLSDVPYWAISSPCYLVKSEQIDKYRKRWDSHDRNLDWGKRKQQFKTSEGAEKSYDLPLYTRLVRSINWYLIGDKDGIKQLLESVTHLQKKRSYGNGEVLQWQITQTNNDYHLWHEDKLIKPVPVRLMPHKLDNPQMIWGWKSPSWLPANKELCYMPKDNVVYAQSR